MQVHVDFYGVTEDIYSWEFKLLTAANAANLYLSGFMDKKLESKLYIGNLDFRITEAALIKMFSPYGKIVSEDFLWHTRGPKRGEPRGFAFIQYSSEEEAVLAKEKMHGRLVCGRPIVVRLAKEKNMFEGELAVGEPSKTGLSSSMSRSARIAAIKNKLKALEEGEEKSSSEKKQKQDKNSS